MPEPPPRVVPPVPDEPLAPPAPSAPSLEPANVAAGAAAQVAEEVAADEAEQEAEDVAADEADELAGRPNPEAESHEAAVIAPGGPRYTAELTDEALTQLWKDDPTTLGSVSVGFTDAGRMLNAVPFPRDGNWLVVDPANTWATQETIDYVTTAISAVCEQFPGSPPIRVNHISRRDGGWLRPHHSHQAGRDVDLGFYYPTAEPVRTRARERYIDVARNWGLLKALVTLTDVQVILVDRRVQKVLYDHALNAGEDRAWLDSLFRAGRASLVQHARRHRDHFHVRFFNPRAQELGRRVQPLLALQPDQNFTMHRIRRGDTLGHIARRYGSSVAAIRKANRMRSTLLSLGRTLLVPLRKPCTRCPLPPPVIVPPRRLPPAVVARDAGGVPARPTTLVNVP